MFPHPPLKSRILKSKDVEPAPKEMAHGRLPYPMEYKSRDMSEMQQAIAKVEKGMPQRKAAEIYKVPRSTLGDYVRGSSSLSSPSECPLLTTEEEEELATFLVEMAAIGYPHTRKQVIAKVQQIVNSEGRDGSLVTGGWWQSYRKRHPKLSLKTAVPLSYNRAKASDTSVLKKYYDMLYKCLDDGGILNKPAAIYNCDESGLPLNPTCHKVVDKAGSRNPSCVTGNGKEQYTVLVCSSATGAVIPPLVVVNRKSISQGFTEGEVTGTAYGLSSNGTFNQWFTTHFLQYATRERPVILLMDGHSSHYSPSTVTPAADNGVVLFTLPPNTTHITQLLDRALHHLKAHGERLVTDLSLIIPARLSLTMTSTRYLLKSGIRP